ncbi:MobF family relaxase [Pseudonocardia sp.]|uniref:MobF family relaxase n=1 Tax=Pseudonocardia sp. TaxID=60912 RepID=UPI0025D64BC5|nr:MobF family relaxase [Pseudonocardia sp.]
MVLSIGSGYSPEYLLKEVVTGRENYYTGAVSEGEPPGRWWGTGAANLGLTGLVDAQDMRALYEGYLDPRDPGFRDPQRWSEVSTLGHTGRKYLSEEELYATALEQEPGASAERRAELRVQAGKSARQNVAFYDLAFNVQKSVTLVHTAFEAKEVAARRVGDEKSAAAWAQCRTAVEDAIWAGNNAMLAYMAKHAGYTRVGKHGGAAGRWADAHDWTVASFFQHDSREHDPHLHIHNTALNRVQGPDGKWRTIDSRALYKFQRAGAAVAERTTEERLTHALGVLVATRPDGKAREIVGVAQEAMDLISTRRRKLTAKADELVEAFEARYGRAPNGLERDRIAQQATLLTRRAKSHTGETREELLDRIDARVRADVSGGLAGVADTVLAAREHAPAPMTWSPQAVIETALTDIQQRKAGWNRGDLTGAINAALPDYLGLPDGADVARLLDTLTDEALTYATVLDGDRPGDAHLPDELRLANRNSAYQAPGAVLYATPEQVHTERALVAATTERGATALPFDRAQRFLAGLAESGIELGVDQAAAVRGVLTSGARVETLIGPAGTGKSFVVGAIARGWTDPAHTGADTPRRVFGLATSQLATEVLKAEGLTASNVAAWLGTQRRLTSGAGAGGPRPVEADQPWRLHAGDLVVVDESAMTDTAALAAVHSHVDAAGAKLLLVGDHRQLAAVGAGGGMDLIAASGARYELAEARRFRHEWERDASLRLRAGDESVLRIYHQQGRLIDAGTSEQAEDSAARAWLGDTLAGRQSMLLVDTNEQAARLSAALRAELVRLGRLQEGGVALGLQGTVAGVGDVVEARAIAWDLAGHEGNPRGVINRERFRITAVRDDGGLEVAPIDGHGPEGDQLGPLMVLPAHYVAEHLALGYASTVHAAQGATVDTTHTVVTSRTGPAALYVGLSRGREANTAHVATLTGVTDLAHGTDHAHALHRDPVAMLARVLDSTEAADAANRSALATATEAATEAGSARTAAELLADAAQLAATERTATWLDQLTADGVLDPVERGRIAAEDGAATLTRILRRAELAGHDPQQVLHDAIAGRPFDGVRTLSNAIYSRIRTEHRDRLDPVGESFADWVPRVENREWSTYLDSLAWAADERAEELGRQLAEEPPAWLTAAIGPLPDQIDDRDDWQHRAGLVAAYRETRGHDDPNDALGPAPKPGQVEQYAAYRAAWRTLGRPEIEREELEMTDGQLRIWIRAAKREEAWAPRYVGNELAGTRQAAAAYRSSAQLRAAEADAAADPAERELLHTEARQARALAETLDEQVAKLQLIDDARAMFLADNARTLGYGRRCEAELTRRHIDDTEPEQLVTAEEWLAADRAAAIEDDQHRDITATDLAPDHDQDCIDDVTAADDLAPTLRLESPDRDIREMAAGEPAPANEDAVRVPLPEETAVHYLKATRALTEIQARRVLDEQEAVEHRAAELDRWHSDDQAAGLESGDDDADELGSYDDASTATSAR